MPCKNGVIVSIDLKQLPIRNAVTSFRHS